MGMEIVLGKTVTFLSNETWRRLRGTVEGFVTVQRKGMGAQKMACVRVGQQKINVPMTMLRVDLPN